MLDGRNSICYFSITDIYIVVKLQHIITYVCSVCSRLNYLSYQHVIFFQRYIQLPLQTLKCSHFRIHISF